MPAFTDRLRALRQAVPDDVTLGVSGDAFASDALLGGADLWYSVVAGTLPEPAVTLTRAAQRGDRAAADAINARLAPLWELFGRYGSYRVVAHLAVLLGLTDTVAVRRPVRPLADTAVAELKALLPRIAASQ